MNAGGWLRGDKGNAKQKYLREGKEKKNALKPRNRKSLGTFIIHWGMKKWVNGNKMREGTN